MCSKVILIGTLCPKMTWIRTQFSRKIWVWHCTSREIRLEPVPPEDLALRRPRPPRGSRLAYRISVQCQLESSPSWASEQERCALEEFWMGSSTWRGSGREHSDREDINWDTLDRSKLEYCAPKWSELSYYIPREFDSRSSKIIWHSHIY